MIRAINRSIFVLSRNCFVCKNNRLAQNGINSIQINVHRSYSNIGVINWIETLSEADKEKVRFINNEASFNGS